MPELISKRLLEVVSQLPAEQAKSLLDFAEFMLERYGAVEYSAPANPSAVSVLLIALVNIPRPPKESVVGAIKRLRTTYPMLDARKMLNQTSDLMTQHIMQGREATAVIDDLEMVFRTNYEQFERECK